jgi:O-acetyl-ADP-ribose deacetylase (regulator of RNase III)
MVVIILVLLLKQKPTPSAASPVEVISQAPADEIAVLKQCGTFILNQEGTATEIHLHGGPIEDIPQVDIIVSSENTFFQMAQSFKPSISGRLRDAISIKDPSGRITDDIAQRELTDWLAKNFATGREVALGTVAPTSSGSLSSRGIKRIYHAAAVRPNQQEGTYTTSKHGIKSAVTHVFETARSENASSADLQLKSICFPLLGAGRGRLDPQESAAEILREVAKQVVQPPHPNGKWTIHLVTWSEAHLEILRTELRNLTGA